MKTGIKFQCLYKGHVFTDEEREARLEHASVIYGWFTEVANKCGYAIARHGSGVRDIDLVAIPWTEEAVSATELVCKLASTFTITLGHYGYDKPHGRAAFSMWHHRWPDQQIDLSVMPRSPTSTGVSMSAPEDMKEQIPDCAAHWNTSSRKLINHRASPHNYCSRSSGQMPVPRSMINFKAWCAMQKRP